MKLTVLLFTLLLSMGTFAQSSAYKDLLKKTEQRSNENQWDEVVILATDLLTEDPSRGDGYYYTALALLKLGEIDRVANYLALASKSADNNLKKKIQELQNIVSGQKNLNVTLVKIEELQRSGKNAEAASEWLKVWQQDKKQFTYALNAVENFVIVKKFPEALEILNDPSLANEPRAIELAKRLNSTDIMKKINTAAEAIENGKQLMQQGQYYMATSSFAEALLLNPEASEAKQLKAIAEDESVWNMAININRVDYYQGYEKGATLKKHLEEARQRIAALLLIEGEKAASRQQVSDMEKYLDQVINNYGNMQQKQKAKEIKCNGFVNSARYYAGIKEYYAQNRASKYFALAGTNCEGQRFEAQVASANKLSKKYSHPSGGFLNFVRDEISTLGLSVGRINNQKLGGYWTMRMKEYFSDKAYYTVNNNNQLTGNINTNIRRSLGKEVKNTNIEALIGVTAKLTYPLWLYLGVGIAENNTLWLMNEYNSSNTLTGTGWAKNTDLSGTDIVMEAGVMMKLGKINFSTGYKFYDSNKGAITLGVGFCR